MATRQHTPSGGTKFAALLMLPFWFLSPADLCILPQQFNTLNFVTAAYFKLAASALKETGDKMNLHIKRSPDYPRKYTICEHPEVYAELKGTTGFILHKLQIYSHGQLFISVKQPNLWRKLFFFVAFLWSEMSPVVIYQNETCIGHSLQLKNYRRYIFYINDQEFEILFHTKDNMSLWIKERQIALFHTNGKGSYDVIYEPLSYNTPELLLLFCVMIDCFQYEYRGGYVHYRLLRKDIYESALNWRPTDE